MVDIAGTRHHGLDIDILGGEEYQLTQRYWP